MTREKAGGERNQKLRTAHYKLPTEKARLTIVRMEDIQAGTVRGKPEKFLKHQEKKINHEAKREL
jgi:hypothetical protein